MRILITVAIWGRDYAETFVNYSLASQLANGNLPTLSRKHEVVYHISTTRECEAWLRTSPSIKLLRTFCTIDWDLIEDLGLNADTLPRGSGGAKYSLLSDLQNNAIKKSLAFDAISFNYADFIWSNGALVNAFEKLEEDTDAVLSFCMPVDLIDGKRDLDDFVVTGDDGIRTIALEQRDAAALTCRNLHREAKLRFWDKPPFTITPTYILWPVDDEGIVVRAYHKTVLAMRVPRSSHWYANGIVEGSLDGFFTTALAADSVVYEVSSSDEGLVFSLYGTDVETKIGGPSRLNWLNYDRVQALKDCLADLVSTEQKAFALSHFEIRKDYRTPERWKDVADVSRATLSRFHEDVEKCTAKLPDQSANNVANPTLGRPDFLARFRTLVIRLIGPRERLALRLLQALDLKKAELIAWHFAAAFPNVRRFFADYKLSDTRVRKMLASGQITELIDLYHVRTVNRALLPNVTVPARAVACIEIGLATERLIARIETLTELDQVLISAEAVFREAIQTMPLWHEAHRFLGRNLWFQGRFDEAFRAFEEGEGCLAILADKAGWPADEKVVLPRNCAHVIGLLGHLDAFIKYKILNGDTRTYELYVNEQGAISWAFLNYWTEYVKIAFVPGGEKPDEIPYSVNWNWVMPSKKRGMVHTHKVQAQIQRAWAHEGRPPLLTLNETHNDYLTTWKTANGIGADEDYILLHVRSAEFYAAQEGTSQAFRNSPMIDYIEMIRAVMARDIWVIRMGDAGMPSLEPEMLGPDRNRFIDYANSEDKSEAMDIALCATCRLFVSSPSGLHTVAHAFGRPVCYVNFPFYAGFPWHPGEIIAPLRYRSRAAGRVLNLDEILSSNLVHADQQFLLERSGIDVIGNSPDDITETVLEALAPEASAGQASEKAETVIHLFDGLVSKYELDMSGRLSTYYAEKYFDELMPSRSETHDGRGA